MKKVSDPLISMGENKGCNLGITALCKAVSYILLVVYQVNNLLCSINQVFSIFGCNLFPTLCFNSIDKGLEKLVAATSFFSLASSNFLNAEFNFATRLFVMPLCKFKSMTFWIRSAISSVADCSPGFGIIHFVPISILFRGDSDGLSPG